MTTETGTLAIDSEDDILVARQRAREIAEELGFRRTDVTRIVTAVSELSRNLYLYAGEGEMRWRALERHGQSGLELQFVDEGPGIENVEAVLAGEHSTSEGMGRGVTGTKQLVDEIEIDTELGEGTTVTIMKWAT